MDETRSEQVVSPNEMRISGLVLAIARTGVRSPPPLAYFPGLSVVMRVFWCSRG